MVRCSLLAGVLVLAPILVCIPEKIEDRYRDRKLTVTTACADPSLRSEPVRAASHLPYARP